MLYFFATKVTFWRPVAKSQCKHLVARIRDLPADHCDLPHDLIPHQLQPTTQQLPCRDDHWRGSGWRTRSSGPHPSACCRSTLRPSRSATARASSRSSQVPWVSSWRSTRCWQRLTSAGLADHSGAGSGTTCGTAARRRTAVPLRASISEERLRAYLIQEVAPRYDEPPTPAQPIPGTTTFTPGKPGQALDVGAAVPLIEDALRSPAVRSVTLPSSESTGVARASVGNLAILMKQLVYPIGF